MVDPQQAQPDSSLPVQRLDELACLQARAIQEIKAQLSTQISLEITNTTKQLEAHQSLQLLIGDVPALLHGWPISPDFALQMVRLIRDNHYDLIIEFGSGTSTYLSLRALEVFGSHACHQNSSLNRLLVFEHLEPYYRKTSDLVSLCANRSLLDLRLSPLESWGDATGNYSYYSGTPAIGEAIRAIAASTGLPLKMLVVIDGPPGATCHWSRYPAVPIVLDAASGTDLSVDFLLDDLIRAEEQEIALFWEHLFQGLGLSWHRVDYAFEKGGLLLSVDSLSGKDTSLARGQVLAAEMRDKEAAAAAVARAESLLAELEAVRQAAALEKATIEKSVVELKQQLADQAQELQVALHARDEQAIKVLALEEELACRPQVQLSERVLQLECDLREAREDGEFYLQQLHLVQEQLEYYCLLATGQLQQEFSTHPLTSAKREQDAAVINGNRDRLLSTD